MELEEQKGKLSHPTIYQLPQTGRDNRKMFSILLPQQEEDFLLAQEQLNQWTTVTTQSMKSNYTLNS